MHSHWSPEPYDKALADLGQPLANPYPLDHDLDKRRKWMDEHGDLMHCLTLSGAMPWQRVTPQQGAHLAHRPGHGVAKGGDLSLKGRAGRKRAWTAWGFQ